jgi:predicted metal-binding transcription factor (methanogenesis marker protein 9)
MASESKGVFGQVESLSDPLYKILLCAENLQRIHSWFKRQTQLTPGAIDACVGQMDWACELRYIYKETQK